MKLYHISKSRSVRVVWLLEELGLSYELERMSFDPKALQAPDYLAINPFGKVPVLVDGPVRMSESVAIIQYLLNRYADGRLEPDHRSPEYGPFLQWLHFGESTLMGPIADLASHQRFLPPDQRNLVIARRAGGTLRQYIGVLDQELEGREYLLASGFSAADIVVGYTFFVLDVFGLMPEDLPSNVRAWYERLKARSAFQKASA